MSPMTHFSNNFSPLVGEGSRDSTVQNPGIVWSGHAWICSRHLKHYPAFCKSGTTISIRSFVFVKRAEETDYLGYVEDLFENEMKEKSVEIRWFQLREEMVNRISDIEAQSNEVFITGDKQVIPAESINGIATVLTPDHFNACLTFLPRDLSHGCFVCHKQYTKNKIKPFRLSKLSGYLNQPIVYALTCYLLRPKIDKEKSTDMGESSTLDNIVVIALEAPKRVGHPAIASQNQKARAEPKHQQVNLKFLNKELVETKFVASEPQCQLLFNVNENVEVLSQDSGLRGCWFRCKILHSSQKFLKVQYYDVLDVEGPGKLEERLPLPKLANFDKLGMRCVSRLTIRPWPCEDISDATFEIGAAVDAWWCNGWWEGVVIGCTSDERKIQVYFPGENKFLSVERKNLRASKDWFDNKWIDIKEKPDVMSLISSIYNPTPKLPPVPTFTEPTTSSGHAKVKHRISRRADMAEDGMSAEAKATQKLHFKKRLQIRYNEDMNCSNSGNAARDYTNSD